MTDLLKLVAVGILCGAAVAAGVAAAATALAWWL